MNNVSIHTFHLDHKMAMPVGPLRISYCLCSIVLLPLFYWLSLTLLHTDKSVGMFYFLFCWHTLMSCRWGAVHTLQLKSWRNKQQPSSMPTSPQPLTATQPPHVFLFLFCPSGFLILNVDAPSSPATLYSGGNALVHQNTCARTHTHIPWWANKGAVVFIRTNDRWQRSPRGKACKFVPVVPRLSEEEECSPSNRCSRGQSAQVGARTRNAF